MKYSISKIYKALLWEWKSGLPLPLTIKMKFWKLGFKSSSYYIYRLNDNNHKSFISDNTVAALSNVNNVTVKNMLNDKVMFQLYSQSFVRVPENFAVIHDGKFYSLTKKGISSEEEILDLVENEKSLVLKPIDGNRGKGVGFLQVKNGELTWNNELIEEKSLLKKFNEMDNYLVSELIIQADYSKEIFPHSTNTIRILAMQDTTNNNQPFIAAAVHRFGTKKTIPADNWSRGGISCPIDIATGIIGQGIIHPKNTNGNLVSLSLHPDTQSKIDGKVIPHWLEIKESILKLTKALDIKYVGWDVLVTNNGFCIIEGNSNSDLDLIQVHAPLLTNKKVVNFMQTYNYI